MPTHIKNLLSEVLQARTEKHTEAAQRYYRLLANIETESTADTGAELLELLTALNKNPTDAQKDHDAVKEAKRLMIEAAKREEADNRVETTEADYLRVCADRQRVHHEQTAIVSAHLAARDDAMIDAAIAMRAKHELEKIKSANPILHAAVTAPVDDDSTPKKPKKK